MSDSVQKWMESIQNSGEPSPPSRPSSQSESADEKVELGQGDEQDEEIPSALPLYSNEIPKFKYSAEANDPLKRPKRAIPSPNKKKSCSLYIQTDPLFWKHVHAQVRHKMGLYFD